MKRIFSLFLILTAMVAFSCSDDAVSPNGGGGLGGGGGNGGGGVTFTIGTKQGQQGGIVFTFKPSTDVTLTTATLKLPAQQYEDVLTNPDPSTVFTAQNVYDLDEYTGVVSGQQWTITFVGKLGSTTGTAFTVTANYTIP